MAPRCSCLCGNVTLAAVYRFGGFNQSKQAACFHRCAPDTQLRMRDVLFLGANGEMHVRLRGRSAASPGATCRAVEQMRRVKGLQRDELRGHLEKSLKLHREQTRPAPPVVR